MRMMAAFLRGQANLPDKMASTLTDQRPGGNGDEAPRRGLNWKQASNSAHMSEEAVSGDQGRYEPDREEQPQLLDATAPSDRKRRRGRDGR